MGTQLFPPGDPNVLYVVDLSSYLLRAYHAVAPLSSPSGEPTHAAYGTVTMLERLFRLAQPHMVAIAMDAGRATFRKEIYPDYKANRPPAPDDLRVQIGRSEEIVRAWGLSVFKQPGVEADDLIATLVRQALELEKKAVIVSADKDLMQLVGRDVVMWDTLRNKVFGPAEVNERFGVGPQLLGDLLALTGDSSDNIPGVPSVGPKTAAKLLNEYGSLQAIFEQLEQISRKKLQQVLRDHEQDARLSRRLVTLKEDCDISATLDDLLYLPEQRRQLARLMEIYEELGFTRQLTALSKAVAADAQQSREPEATGGAVAYAAELEPELAIGPVTLVADPLALQALIDQLDGGALGLELYTLRPDLHRGPLIGACVATSKGQFYLPFAHRVIGGPEAVEPALLLSPLLAAIDEKGATVYVHDLKRSLVLLREAGLSCELPRAQDTLLGSYLLDPERNHQLEALGASVRLQVPDYDSFSKEKRKKRGWDELEPSRAAELAATRALAIFAGGQEQAKRLNEDGMRQLLDEVETPLARLLSELQVRGVLIDTERLQLLGKECHAELSVLEQQAHQAAGKEFNVNSPRQLETILFDEIGLKPQKRTKTSRSTDAQTLEVLSDDHELPKIILQIRQIAKLVGTYIEALPALVDEHTGRIHGSWEQAVAATGRLSSTDPNLQNIPIRTELGRKIRDAFIAPPGHQLVSADYSQIELRVLAHLSGDERLVEAFQQNQDVHTRTAMEIFEVQADQVTREMRSRAKAVNFGVIYGQGESALAKSVGIERSEAARFIATYFRRYDGVREFMDATLSAARDGQAVRSILGRRRVVPDIRNGNRGRRLAAERIAMNMPIQGSAADILKLAMLGLAKPVTPGTKMVLTVHDELVFEIPDDEVETAKPLIVERMQAALPLSVPLVVDIGSGDNWNSAH